jgi:histidine ammonia-lyase
MDFLKIGVCELGNISERRTARLIDPALSEGLPAFLINKEQGGVSSGLMIPQYVAAALVSENKVLAHPASVDSIPTSANQEDHVSMGTIAARQVAEIIKNVQQVLAIELYSAAQAAEFRKPLALGKGTSEAYACIRAQVPAIEKDRILYPDIEKIAKLCEGEIIDAVERGIGKALV